MGGQGVSDVQQEAARIKRLSVWNGSAGHRAARRGYPVIPAAFYGVRQADHAIDWLIILGSLSGTG